MLTPQWRQITRDNKWPGHGGSVSVQAAPRTRTEGQGVKKEGQTLGGMGKARSESCTLTFQVQASSILSFFFLPFF